jgi:hypothetical protein
MNFLGLYALCIRLVSQLLDHHLSVALYDLTVELAIGEGTWANESVASIWRSVKWPIVLVIQH